MEQKAPTPKVKAFVTHKVDGFPDGHPLELRGKFDFQYGSRDGLEFFGTRKTETGINLVVLIPATPDAMDAHVRIKAIPQVRP